MRGWFDAFRTDGGPTLYAYSNRTSVTGDISILTICLVFLTIYIAFVVIFPGIRKERFSTFCTVTLSLLTGIIICVCLFGSDWEVSSGVIKSSYRAFSSQKIKGSIGVKIGLDHTNVTLKVIPTDNRTLDINYNERFTWLTTNDMKRHYRKALEKGLPYPILTAAEYLTVDKEGLSWGRYYRSAGYYTSIALWTAFTSWILANILLLNVPRYGAYMMMLTGSLMILAIIIYWCLKPMRPLAMRFEDVIITFRLGWCFWTTLIVGTLVTVSGLIISTVDWIYPHKFSTILEVDFDTPYDRHIIIEESIDTGKRKFRLEELNVGRTVGSRLLRRLSKRGKEAGEEVETNPGVDNHAFELDPSAPAKSAWKSSVMRRADSKKSNKSVIFRNKVSGLFEVSNLPEEEEEGEEEDNKERQKKSIKRLISKQNSSADSTIVKISGMGDGEVSSAPDSSNMKRQDSQSSASSTSSSYGLGLLSRDPSIRNLQVEENDHQPVVRNNSGNIIVFHKTDSRGQLQRLNGEVVEIQTDVAAGNW